MARRRSLARRIYATGGLLAFAAAAIIAYALAALDDYQRDVDRMVLASARAQLGAEIDGLINAVVMESRGIYMTAEREQARRYGDNLLKAVDRMVQRRDRLVATYDDRAAMARGALVVELDRFAATRRELVRLSREPGAGALAAARAFGDNDQNRAGRQALNAAMETYVADSVRAARAADAALERTGRQLPWVLVGGGLAAILLACLVAVIVVRRTITGPLAGLADAIARLAAGDLDRPLPPYARPDEIGAIGDAVAVFRQGLQDNRRLAEENEAARAREAEARQAAEERRLAEAEARRLAATRETERVAAELEAQALREAQAREAAATAAAQREDAARRAAAMTRAIDEFREQVAAALAGLGGAAAEMSGSARAIGATARDTSVQTGDVLASTTASNTQLQTAATASEELSASIAEISRQIAQSSGLAEQAASHSSGIAGRIRLLDETARDIGGVIGLIQAIAGQTNLLALNATIEAARAGDAGKGFAVVAGEVKNLASQTARATEDIGRRVQTIQDAVGGVVAAIGEMAGLIGGLTASAAATSAAVAQQTAATGDIARNLNATAVEVEAMTGRAARMRDSAAEAGQAAAAVEAASAAVERAAAAIRDQVGRFLQTMAGVA